MSHPWQDAISETYMSRNIKAPRATLFKQIIGELTESKCILVVAEPMPCDGAKPDIVEARSVVVAVFDTETRCSADDQSIKIRIRKQCGSQHPSQNIQSRDRRGIAHQR